MDERATERRRTDEIDKGNTVRRVASVRHLLASRQHAHPRTPDPDVYRHRLAVTVLQRGNEGRQDTAVVERRNRVQNASTANQTCTASTRQRHWQGSTGSPVPQMHDKAYHWHLLCWMADERTRTRTPHARASEERTRRTKEERRSEYAIRTYAIRSDTVRCIRTPQAAHVQRERDQGSGRTLTREL